MTILRLGVVLVFAAGCFRQQMYGPGRAGNFDVSGTYSVEERTFDSRCAHVAPGRAQMDVQHAPGEKRLTIYYRGAGLVGTVAQSGRFDASTPAGANELEQMTMSGQFYGDSTISARAQIRSMQTMALPARGLQTCQYEIELEGRMR